MYETDLAELEKKYKLSEFPLNVIIEPGNYCNLNCITCTNDKMTRKRGNMDIRLYKKIIDEIAIENPHTRIWLDYYGEPLLQRFKLYYMIDYAKKKGLTNISTNTNGTLLDEEMAEMLLDSGIDFVSIDCDGFSKEVYEKIRVNADRDKVYKNIEYFLMRKKERNIENLKIEIKIMEMEENKHEIQQVLDYWRARGAWTATRRLITWGGQCENIDINANPDRIACGAAIGVLPITWDGRVANCVSDTDLQYCCGDVNKETIRDIWARRNDNFLKYHMEHRWRELPIACQQCNDWMIVGENRYDEKGNPVNKNYDRESKML